MTARQYVPSTDSNLTLDAGTTLGDLGERALISLIDSIVGDSPDALGIGDDAAAFTSPPGSDILATTDSLVEGVHFRVVSGGGKAVGEKALAVNLSDIAAMGGIPRWALTSLTAPPAMPVAYVRDIYAGLVSMARRFNVTIVGGNVSASRGALVVDVTLLGYAPSGQIITRSGAQVGDLVAVTGTLGRSAAHRVLVDLGKESEDTSPIPQPRIAFGRALAEARIAHAMMDISDGLATDIYHVADASGTGAVIYADRVPVDIAARRAGSLANMLPLDIALYGGEDYELLVALPEDVLPSAVDAAGDVPLTVVGTILAPEHGVLLEQTGGAREPLEARGWEHFRPN